MLYTLFPRDCSSIGQSTALSRRKLRVRAPSVPMDPNPIRTNMEISISSTSSDGRKPYVPYVNYRTIMGSIIFWKRKNIVLGLVDYTTFNGIEYYTFPGSTYTKGIYLDDTQKGRSDVNSDLTFSLSKKNKFSSEFH